MYKSTYLILLALFTIHISAQEKRIDISGEIKSKDNVVKNIHIINKTSKKGTISRSDGQFSIPVKINDTLLFRGIQFKSQELIITKKDISNNAIQIKLISKTNVLKEVSIKKRENMAMTLNLPNAGKSPLEGVDLKLAYYSQESTPIVLLKALLLSEKGGIDNIYNIISGNRKKHRKFKKLIEDDKQKAHDKKILKQIRLHYKDDFFVYTIKIPSKNIDTFIEYCQTKKIIQLYDKENFLKIMDIFIKESKPFLKKMKDEK